MSRRKATAANLTLILAPSPLVRVRDIESLADADLLATATGLPASEAADAVRRAHGLKPLLQQTVTELEVNGFDPEVAAQFTAMAELARRIGRAGDTRPVLATPEAIYGFLKPELLGKSREEFWVIAFNSRNAVLRAERVAQGTASACPVDPKDVFGVAIAAKAAAIVVAHNHPSGDPTPSAADLVLTRQLVRGAELLCVRVLDHIIVGDDRFASMAQRGELARC